MRLSYRSRERRFAKSVAFPRWFTVPFVLIVGLMLTVFCVLIAGVVLMGVGGPVNARYSHKLMSLRVSLQG